MVDGDIGPELQPGLLHVRVVRHDLSKKKVLVEFPSEVVTGGRRIWVSKTKVRG